MRCHEPLAEAAASCFADAEPGMAEVQKAAPADWRIAWYRGRALLAQGKTQETLVAFRDVERYALVDRANEVRPVTWV